MVISSTPDRIRVEKPEGRGGRACREIDEDGSLLFSQAFDEVDGGVEVAVEGASWKDTVRVASSVELELIDVVLIDHRETCGLKPAGSISGQRGHSHHKLALDAR